MDSAPDAIKRLVERFHRQIEQMRAPEFNEAQLRIDFINPMFRALGWDVDNTQGFAEQYREVVYEDRLKVGGATKAPDYSFRIGGMRKFFLEAKKPAVNIKENWESAYQLRRYGWSAKLGVSLLTDFEELAIYDCRIQPKHLDKASTARREYITYLQYESRWDFLFGTFSKDAILRGDFDRYCGAARGRRAEEFDEAFLVEIESWRLKLASVLALRNGSLSERSLNFAVQRIIDRIIFLRICEDRGLERIGRLQSLLNGDEVYARLLRLFRDADDRYNSGLFHFNPEKGREELPDELTPGLQVDDAAIKSIIKRLYYPESPYEFSVVSADILGSVYERFLGKIISLTAGHRARIEEKPEVRKAGGVYYTPSYIVDYIIQQTVGKLLDGKTPKEAAKLTVLDPACGSGSFLLGAYQLLLDWHLNWYVNDGAKKWARGKKAVLRSGQHGGWHLTIKERKRILLDNIYGVDIDYQAVEVTKLSLLLRVLEGETTESLGGLWALSHERALPDLGKNIQCGNSVIGTALMATETWNQFSDEERRRINVFDYEHGFPDIAKAGGFDAVVGNPPYIRIQLLTSELAAAADILKATYASAKVGNYDIYVVFIEKGMRLLNRAGRLGMILPIKFANSSYGEPIRQLIAARKALSQLVDFGSQQVFAGATTYACLLFLSATRQRDGFTYHRVADIAAWRKDGTSASGIVAHPAPSGEPWSFRVGPTGDLAARLDRLSPKLGEIADIFVGVQTSADDIFILDVTTWGESRVAAVSRADKDTVFLEASAIRPIISGTDVKRYVPLRVRQCVLFPYDVRDERATLRTWRELIENAPKAAAYLAHHRKTLEQRENAKFSDECWYRFGRNQNIGIQSRPKLCVPRLVERLCATIDESGDFCLDNVDVGGVTLRKEATQPDLKYILALLNSRLLGWYFPHISAPFRGGWYSANRQFLSRVPILSAEVRDRNRIAGLAEEVLALHKQERSTNLPQEKEQVRRQIAAIDRRIDQLVYTIYALSSDEIRIVESAAPSK
ncbi:MAG TPA: N-6 DNA methylase [Tepidisphaeraceae bacterium]|nr:N-6 DNA methylase [Tepidisphaeraceae bacterium]